MRRLLNALIPKIQLCLLLAGVIGLLILSSSSDTSAEAKAKPTGKLPNILLIVVDTLSAKHLGSYDDQLATSPRIDKWAETGRVFTQARTTAPWTKPSLASIFSAKYPSSHGVIRLESEVDPSLHTLAEDLSARGYKTAGVVSHTLIAPDTNFRQGFETYEIVKFRGNVHDSITSDQVTDRAVEWLTAREKQEEPFFLFLHYFDPHFNYMHHVKFDQSSWYKGRLSSGMGFRKVRDLLPTFIPDDMRYLEDLYQEEIAFTDYFIGKLFDSMDSLGLREDTMIVFTADHGEEFGEHGGIGHTHSLYDELIRVPLIISYLGVISPGRIDTSVSTMDIFPTLKEYLFEADGGEEIDGQSFSDCLRGSATCGDSSRPVFFEVDFKSSRIKEYKLGLVRGGHKYILDKPTGDEEFYNLAEDPNETVNLVKKGGKLLSEARAATAKYRSERQANIKEDVNAEEKAHSRSAEETKQLESLGYL